MLTSANAQKLQNTNAWAMPGKGRSRMTFAWHITSQMRCQILAATEPSLKSGSDLAKRMRSTTRPNRNQNSQTEIRMRASSTPREIQMEAMLEGFDAVCASPISSMEEREIRHFGSRWLHWITPVRPLDGARPRDYRPRQFDHRAPGKYRALACAAGLSVSRAGCVSTTRAERSH